MYIEKLFKDNDTREDKQELGIQLFIFLKQKKWKTKNEFYKIR